MLEKKIEYIQNALKNSKYTVVLCGSGMLEEAGVQILKKPEKAYVIEERYGVSPEYMFTDAYYSTRTDKFFDFYRREVLCDIKPTEAAYRLADLEREKKVQCMITSNIYELLQRAGCCNVINMHGSIYRNKCSHCGKEYSMEYVRDAKRVPLCEACGSVIRPQVSLFGDMLDNSLIARTAIEIEKADVLLILGTTLDSEVFHNYIKYFNGSKLILIHREKHIKDINADLVIYDEPGNVLSKLTEF